jgi:hypothetical protein
MPSLIRSRHGGAALLPLLAAAALAVALAAPSSGHAFSPHPTGTRGHLHASTARVAGSPHLAFGPAHTSDGSATTLGYFRPAPGSDGGGCQNPDGCVIPPANCTSIPDPNGCAGGQHLTNCGLSMDPNGCASAKPATDCTGPPDPNGCADAKPSADCCGPTEPNGCPAAKVLIACSISGNPDGCAGG